MASEPGGAQAVERALGLLAVLEQHDELRVSELVELTGLGQSTVSRLLAVLKATGFVSHDARSGLFRIGTRTIGLAAVALNNKPVHREGRQVAQGLACELGLGVNVAEFVDKSMRYLCHFEGALAPRSFTMIGRAVALHATGLGKAVLATLSTDQVEACTPPDSLRVYTPNTLAKHTELHQELARIRDRGYATEVEELAFGRACVAAAIRDRGGTAVGALSISGSMSAMDLGRREQELALKAIEAADVISIGLGYVADSAATL